MTKLQTQIDQFERALKRLKEVIAIPESEIIRDSAIQRFEFTLDLAWKSVKTYLEDKNGILCSSPKECFKEAYRQNLVSYDEEWLTLVDLRNETVHTYNEETAQKIYAKLPAAVEKFEELFAKLK